MDESTIKLGRRALRGAGWRWLPGMLTRTGARCLAPAGADGRCFWAISDGQTAWVGNVTDVPDLTDAATRGCLLTLVRQAWGDPGIHVQREGANWVVPLLTSAPSEAEALVAALELAAIVAVQEYRP